MSMNPTIAELLTLSPAERILIVEQLWDSIADLPDAEVELTEAQRRELDFRLEALRRDPNRGSPWEEVKIRLEGGG